ncbi:MULTISPECIES: acyl-CoA dehydrogenase [Bradyrhizobium]|jgi:acyl-CoA dehydrogenase|uniref:acyl-CoA dehydrogenase n=1 Tax=Bradyrhizobium TaxID=374 RepID=UPI0004815B43|nr:MULTISPECIES: acyl-CoA dehydrogenase [Bradyrhizobium]MCS3446729.1 acyl-CoA dehydrogenase [Bradyrhizobium elkanii]MCS3562137.1 acyl-CoA dehydrogenase [Bradyrhizobium elkanii]MCW2148025.1 acyl-CoA dehydrogenase [Bradyrhizobium elkanii]MCW2352891.1 acyl-CoA dehydrogenase [Bradyrhizobium elkanii]MCW2371751.1 acyl-CoA dehydrogenase [Bradyrhizobium elkanii]
MSFRRDYMTKPIFSWARGVLPTMSDTEREALEAGDVWWDADLFTGNPDWSKLLAFAPARLTDEEQAFLHGPVDELCRMLDEWKINWEWRDLPPEVWAFIKAKKFFGMIIPREFGGLGFSPYAHSEVVRKISSRSLTAAVTVMVPNSLGPGELLMRFGTKEQQDKWLPRLASGQDIPCFGLTSPEAGSDAASMIDTGIICKGDFEGREVLGLRLNWHKRYITLGPVSTLLGLAFKAYDPDHLVGSEEELGITVALIPTHLPGVSIGHRHLPAMQVFQNGPNWGRDVFIPLDYIIGGQERLGQGWKMLMTALAAGRGISLPSLSAAGAAYAARTTGAYARIREQFGISISKFEGIEEPLARIAGTAYLLDAARRLTCAALNEGHHPAVISGIMKLHATERMRIAIDDAMDIHGGKAVIDGPQNYLGGLYRSVPVGITVEGANILTRNLIVFGQGAIRAHPYLLQEMNALGEPDRDKGLTAFDTAFWKHVGHSFATMFRAWGRSWSFGLFAPAPDAGDATEFYRQLSRYSSAFALSADMALLTLGGALKRKEMLSARFGDILSELYLLSAALKRWQDEGRQKEDIPALQWCMASGFKTIENRFAEIFANLPNRPVAWLLKFLIQPFGARVTGPSDRVVQQCAQLVLSPSAARDRLTPDLAFVEDDGGIARLEKAFRLVTEAEDAAKQLRAARLHDWKDAVKKGVITEADGEKLAAAHEAVAKVIEVDDFAPEALSPIYKKSADVHQFFQELGEQRAAS